MSSNFPASLWLHLKYTPACSTLGEFWHTSETLAICVCVCVCVCVCEKSYLMS